MNVSLVVDGAERKPVQEPPAPGCAPWAPSREELFQRKLRKPFAKLSFRRRLRARAKHKQAILSVQ